MIPKSKKLRASLAGGVVVLLVNALREHLGMSEIAAQELAQQVVYIVGAYVVGQGVADLGKEKAKVEIEANGGEK
jgi:hypothetical protein